MATQTIYYTALVAHIVGITMVAGTTMADYVIFKQFWKQLESDRLRAIAINKATSKFPMAFGLGFLLLIISGVTMMYITHGVFGEQTWFRIKFGLLLLIIINGLVVGRRQVLKLRKLLEWEVPGEDVKNEFLKVKRNISIFHIAQMTLFLIIFILSVFKFN